MSGGVVYRLRRAKFSWTFTRTVLGHGRWHSFKQAVRNGRHLPTPTDNQERRRLESVGGGSEQQ